jgi:hypothetical protein
MIFSKKNKKGAFMNYLKKSAMPVLIASIWISISEFFRNEFLLKSYWTEHYAGLGLIFPSEPVNGALWGLWSLLFAIVIFILAKKFTFWGNFHSRLGDWFCNDVDRHRQSECAALWSVGLRHSSEHTGSIAGCLDY